MAESSKTQTKAAKAAPKAKAAKAAPSADAKATQSALSKAKAARVKARAQVRGACQVPNCKRPYRAKGYCVTHYAKWRRGEADLKKQRYKVCSKEECRKPMFRWGLCEEHYNAAAKKGEAQASA